MIYNTINIRNSEIFKFLHLIFFNYERITKIGQFLSTFELQSLKIVGGYVFLLFLTVILRTNQKKI